MYVFKYLYKKKKYTYVYVYACTNLLVLKRKEMIKRIITRIKEVN